MGPAITGLDGCFSTGCAHVLEGGRRRRALVALGNMAATAVETQALPAAEGVCARVVIVWCGARRCTTSQRRSPASRSRSRSSPLRRWLRRLAIRMTTYAAATARTMSTGLWLRGLRETAATAG
jgi:hypothetical protein